MAQNHAVQPPLAGRWTDVATDIMEVQQKHGSYRLKVDLPREKRIEIGLTHIHGIGRKNRFWTF